MLLVALIGTVFAVRDQAKASFIVGTADMTCTQNPSSGSANIGDPVVLTCSITVSNATDGVTFPNVTINVDDQMVIATTVGTGEFAACADITDNVNCAASAELNAGTETITISGTIGAGAAGQNVCVQGNGFMTDDAGAGTVTINETSNTAECVSLAGATASEDATNLISFAHTITFSLPVEFTCESDVVDDGVRTCSAADVALDGATLVSGPTVVDSVEANPSDVTVTINSAVAGEFTVCLAVHIDGGVDNFVDTADPCSTKTYQTVAEFLADSVIRHYDVDAGSEAAADGDGTGDGLLLGNDGDVDLGDGTFAPNTDSDLDQVEDDDDAIGSLHTVCIVNTPLTHTVDAGFIEWVIEDAELDPTVDAGVEISSNDLAVDPGPDADYPCFQWASGGVGDQTVTAIYDPDGDDVGLAGVPIRFDGANGTQPLIKEWNSIDTTRIVAVSGLVGNGDSSNTIDDNTGELAQWDTGGTALATDCERDINSDGNAAGPNPFWCGARANVDGTVVTVAGGLTVDGFVAAASRSFIEYTLGSHTTHFNGPIDGAQTVFTFSGCGEVLIEDPETGDVIELEGGSTTVLSSNYGIGFTFVSSDDGVFECSPGDTATLTIATSQDLVLNSAEDTAPNETITVNYFAQQVAKQPLLAWAGQRIFLPHYWGDAVGCFAGDFDNAKYEIESGGGAFVPTASLGEFDSDSDSVFLASLGGIQDADNFDFDNAFDECISGAVYEQEFQGQVDIKATLIDCTNDAGTGGDNCVSTGIVYNFLVYYMEFEDIKLGIVGGERVHHNNGLFDPTGNINDATTDTAAATANVSADVLLRARVRGWFKTSSLDTEGTNRPAEGGRPSGRYVMPDDWLLLAGGETALLFRPNYDTMLTAGGAVSCGGSDACSSSPIAGVPVSTANPAVPNSDVAGPFSLLDVPGEASNEIDYGRDTWLPDGAINSWDAPMPVALFTFSFVGETAASTATSAGFLKEANKFNDVYGGQNPYYWQEIPESQFISCQNYLWCSWANDDGWYPFWDSVLTNRFPNSLASSAHANSTELAQIQGQYGPTIGRILNVYSDNHGEAMVFANGDFRLTYDDCDTNVIGGGKHCTIGDKVGTSNVFAVADYPDFKKKPQIASTPVAITWTWGGYKEVTIEAGETDQFKYVVFHALDRDEFCSIPLVQAQAYDLGANSQFEGTAVAGGVNDRALKPVYLTAATGGTLTFVNTAIPHLVTRSVSLHPVLSSLDALNTIGANDPVESVDFIVDAGEGIVLTTSNGTGNIDPTKRFVTGVPTYSTALNTTIKEFPTLHGSADECQAWIRVSNSLLGILNVIVVAHDDEGDIGFDTIVDFSGTADYTLTFRWSLITYAGPTVPVTDALKGTGANDAGNDIFDQVTAVYGWDQAAQQWLGFFPSGVDVPGANDLTQLETGKAYWIAIKGPGNVTWTVATNVGG